jgi:hypothetical protein
MKSSFISTRNFNHGIPTHNQWMGRWGYFILVVALGLLVAGCNFPVAVGEDEHVPDDTPAPTSDTGSISGVFWHDLCESSSLPGELPQGCVESASKGFYHANGILEPGEPGIEGVEITLGVGVCPARGIAVAITGTQGEYHFSNLEPGVYCVAVNNVATHSAALEPGMWTYPKTDGGLGVGWFTVYVRNDEDVRGVNFGWGTYLQAVTISPEPTGTPVPEPACMDHATFITDVTIPDWTTVEVGETFEKVWRLKNTGTCIWTTDYWLVFQSGELRGTLESYPLMQEVLPGDSIDLSVELVAPGTQGEFRSYWMLQNSEGENFGIGDNADRPFWAKVNVGVIPSPTAVVSWTPRLDPGELVNEGRWIDVDLGDQMLTAYEGSNPVMSFLVSTGTASHPTVMGQFRIWVKLESTRMTGPGYDLKDVPYTMYFYEGYGLHGAYWHNNFGTPMSHGCVNLSPTDSAWLFNFANVGTLVNIHS